MNRVIIQCFKKLTEVPLVSTGPNQTSHLEDSASDQQRNKILFQGCFKLPT